MSWDSATYRRDVAALQRLAEARGEVLTGVAIRDGHATGTFEPKPKRKAREATGPLL